MPSSRSSRSAPVAPLFLWISKPALTHQSSILCGTRSPCLLDNFVGLSYLGLPARAAPANPSWLAKWLHTKVLAFERNMKFLLGFKIIYKCCFVRHCCLALPWIALRGVVVPNGQGVNVWSVSWTRLNQCCQGLRAHWISRAMLMKTSAWRVPSKEIKFNWHASLSGFVALSKSNAPVSFFWGRPPQAVTY